MKDGQEHDRGEQYVADASEESEKSNPYLRQNRQKNKPDKQPKAPAGTAGKTETFGSRHVKLITFLVCLGIFLAVFQHPAGQHGAATGDDAHDAVLLDGHFRAALGQTAVHGHEVHALAGLFFDLGEQVVRLHAGDVPVIVQDLLAHGIHGHRAQRARAGSQHAGTDGIQITGDGKIHDRIGSGFQGHGQLAFFGVQTVAQRRGADIGVDLDAGRLAHDDGRQARVGGIAQQDHAAGFDGAGDGFRGKALFLGKGGQMLVEKAAQGGVTGEDGRHGFASLGLDAGRKKSHNLSFAGAAQLPYGSANCVRFTGSGTIPLSAVQLPFTAPLAGGHCSGLCSGCKVRPRRRGLQ